MATTTFQRWGILTIVAVTVIGTLGGFAAMVLGQQYAAEQQAEFQRLNAKYEKEKAERDKKVAAQSDALSAQYYETFKQYSDRVAAFDIHGVKELATEDLAVGEGEEISSSTKFAAYYLGWDANGHKFKGGSNLDIDKQKLDAPLSVADGLDEASLITGWKEGIKGMRIGGVRLITIPSDKAYGEQGSKDESGKEVIAPNMPLKFVVMAIPAPVEIPQPDSTELMNLYSKMNQY